MAKHLVDIDEQALNMARTELGTTTIKDTVNAALRQATSQRVQRVAAALDTLAAAPLRGPRRSMALKYLLDTSVIKGSAGPPCGGRWNRWLRPVPSLARK